VARGSAVGFVSCPKLSIDKKQTAQVAKRRCDSSVFKFIKLPQNVVALNNCGEVSGALKLRMLRSRFRNCRIAIHLIQTERSRKRTAEVYHIGDARNRSRFVTRRRAIAFNFDLDVFAGS
jgi:hypothetical protein